MSRLRYILFCFSAAFTVTYFTYSKTSDDRFDEKHVLYNQYCIIPNAFGGGEIEEERIAQILHMSSNILDDRLVDQVKNWNAPVSLSIVLIHKADYYSILKKLKDYITRNPLLQKYLRVHLMYPSSWTTSCEPNFDASTSSNISKPTTQELADYPANTARNVARMFSPTKYILIADYEHLFSKNFENSVLKLTQKVLVPGSKQLLVYRIFEIEEGAEEPETKADLHKLMEEKKAVIFHGAFSQAHAIPRLDEWFAEKGSKNGIFWKDIGYTKYSWEPQFISRSDIPMHDINFPFLTRDNTVLRWELCRAGYQFGILSDHFMYHKGIKRTFASNVQHKNGEKFNRALRAWNQRVDTSYPETKSKCPVITARYGK